MLHGRFFVLSADLGTCGPWDAIEDALAYIGLLDRETGAFRVGSAITSFSCDAWSQEELIRRLDLVSFDVPARFVIDGEWWYLEEVEREQRRLRGVEPGRV